MATGTRRILVVDDDAPLLDVLCMGLEDHGFQVLGARDGRLGLECFLREHPDLVVLDIVMPEMDGLELCRHIRARSRTPILMLSSRDEELDKVLGLELGADDYVTKPFSTRELVARIRAVLRRGSGEAEASASALSLRALRLDPARREVRVNGRAAELTATEFDLLYALASAPGLVCSRDALIDKVYGVDVVVSHRTIDTFIKRLRKKLGELDPSFDEIETVRSIGYRYRA